MSAGERALASQASALATILKQAAQYDLPNAAAFHGTSNTVTLYFESHADLVQWALWAEAVVEATTLPSGNVLHVAVGSIYDEAVELIFLEAAIGASL